MITAVFARSCVLVLGLPFLGCTHKTDETGLSLDDEAGPAHTSDNARRAEATKTDCSNLKVSSQLLDNDGAADEYQAETTDTEETETTDEVDSETTHHQPAQPSDQHATHRLVVSYMPPPPQSTIL